jgi:all-trans-8'-apo-beta-carotenal 15,15'-oxygenase
MGWSRNLCTVIRPRPRANVAVSGISTHQLVVGVVGVRGVYAGTRAPRRLHVWDMPKSTATTATEPSAAPFEPLESLKHRLARDYAASQRPVTEEFADNQLLPTFGTVPSGLRGALYRNGGGKQEAFGTAYAHPFDGDGMLTRFAFSDEGAIYSNRYVRTREFEQEASAGRMLYRGFGTNLPGGIRANAMRLRFKNAANTSVVEHRGQLLALWEGGQPHLIEPRSLQTLGRYDFAGALRNPFGMLSSMLSPELPFSAHPKLCPRTAELWNFGTLMGPSNRLLVYCRDPESGALTRRDIPLRALTFVHDFVLTPRYCVFFLYPVAFALGPALLGVRSPADALQFSNGPTRILLVPRDGSDVLNYEVPSCFVFHFVNAFEHGQELCVDGLRMDRYPLSDRAATKHMEQRRQSQDPADYQHQYFLNAFDYPPPLLTRFTLQLGSGIARVAQLTQLPSELPTVAAEDVGERHTASFAVCPTHAELTPFFTCVVRFGPDGAVEAKREFPGCFPSEPVLVGRQGARVLSTLVYDPATHRSSLHLLDPKSLERVAELPLPHHVPPGFHGTWIDG